MASRREFLKVAGISAAALAALRLKLIRAYAQIPGGTLDPLSIPKYQTPMLITKYIYYEGFGYFKGICEYIG